MHTTVGAGDESPLRPRQPRPRPGPGGGGGGWAHAGLADRGPARGLRVRGPADAHHGRRGRRVGLRRSGWPGPGSGVCRVRVLRRLALEGNGWVGPHRSLVDRGPARGAGGGTPPLALRHGSAPVSAARLRLGGVRPRPGWGRVGGTGVDMRSTGPCRRGRGQARRCRAGLPRRGPSCRGASGAPPARAKPRAWWARPQVPRNRSAEPRCHAGPRAGARRRPAVTGPAPSPGVAQPSHNPARGRGAAQPPHTGPAQEQGTAQHTGPPHERGAPRPPRSGKVPPRLWHAGPAQGPGAAQGWGAGPGRVGVPRAGGAAVGSPGRRLPGGARGKDSVRCRACDMGLPRTTLGLLVTGK
ncbi:hypothetical protein C9F11_30660 [Streptomyces sp. YIM 121038]|nr:hypothetical protein C9F11_30660 [Streptomyces sp. YIM 121038]